MAETARDLMDDYSHPSFRKSAGDHTTDNIHHAIHSLAAFHRVDHLTGSLGACQRSDHTHSFDGLDAADNHCQSNDDPHDSGNHLCSFREDSVRHLQLDDASSCHWQVHVSLAIAAYHCEVSDAHLLLARTVADRPKAVNSVEDMGVLYE